MPAVVPLDDIDLDGAGRACRSFAVSAQPRRDGRAHRHRPPLEAGRYFVRVTGYQGAVEQPARTRCVPRCTPPRFSGACPASTARRRRRSPPLDTTLPGGHHDAVRRRPWPPGDDLPGDGADDVTARRSTSSRPPSTRASGDDTDPFGAERAGVLDVSSLAGVQAAYDTWDADPCNPAAANARRHRQLGAAIDDVVDHHPTIAHVVLVGNDDQIPFARVRDATVYSNEREYAVEVGDAQSPLTAALSLGYLLSDDPYGDANP